MTAPGKVMLSTGTAWVMMSVVEEPSTEAVPAWVNLYFHAVPHRWLGGQLVGGFGATVDWWLQQLWQTADDAETARSEKSLYEHLDAAVGSSPPGSRGLLFLSLTGPSQVPNAVQGGGFIGMELVHTRADMCRAILEGCAYEVRWALDELRSAGIPVEELWLAGGATRSPVWPQILADVIGVPIVVASYASWAAVGAAALAGWGIHAYSTLEEGIARLQPPVRRLAPDPALATLYSSHLATYQRIARAVNSARSSAGRVENPA